MSRKPFEPLDGWFYSSTAMLDGEDQVVTLGIANAAIAQDKEYLSAMEATFEELIDEYRKDRDDARTQLQKAEGVLKLIQKYQRCEINWGYVNRAADKYFKDKGE